MKAMLISMGGAPVTPSYFMPDNGLAGLSACLLEAGHEVEVLDLNTLVTMDRLFPEGLRKEAGELISRREDGKPISNVELERYELLEKRLDEHRTLEFKKIGQELAVRAEKNGTQMVGFKLWNGDGWTGTIHLARAVRNRLTDKVFIVGGGSQVDFFGDVLLRQVEAGVFDAFSYAEGEPTVLAIGEHIEKGTDLYQIPNLVVPGSPSVRTSLQRVNSLEELPCPCYDDSIYPQKGRMLVATFEETRGCPHKCAFCAHPLKAGSTRRDFSPAIVLENMIKLQEKYGFRGFKLGGSYTPNNYLREFCNAIVDRKTRIPFCSYGRISDAREADFPLYRQAGCEALFFGLESGSQLILNRAINKGHRVPDSIRVLKAAKDAGIYVLASTIFPNPGETAESREATLDVIRQIDPDGVPLLYPIPLPYSRWFEKPERYGFQIDQPQLHAERLAKYKARILLPLSLWEKLDYRIDGKPFEVFSKETELFSRDVAAMGSVVHMSDEIVLFARLAGLPPKDILGQFGKALLSGDVASVENLISRINTFEGE